MNAYVRLVKSKDIYVYKCVYVRVFNKVALSFSLFTRRGEGKYSPPVEDTSPNEDSTSSNSNNTSSGTSPASSLSSCSSSRDRGLRNNKNDKNPRRSSRKRKDISYTGKDSDLFIIIM